MLGCETRMPHKILTRIFINCRTSMQSLDLHSHTCDMTGFGLPLKGTASDSVFRPRPYAFSSELVKMSSMGIRINCIMHWTCSSEIKNVSTTLSNVVFYLCFCMVLDCHTWVLVPTFSATSAQLSPNISRLVSSRRSSWSVQSALASFS